MKYEVTNAIKIIRLKVPPHKCNGSYNRKSYFTRSLKLSLEEQERLKQRHDVDWWIE